MVFCFVLFFFARRRGGPGRWEVRHGGCAPALGRRIRTGAGRDEARRAPRHPAGPPQEPQAPAAPGRRRGPAGEGGQGGAETRLRGSEVARRQQGSLACWGGRQYLRVNYLFILKNLLQCGAQGGDGGVLYVCVAWRLVPRSAQLNEGGNCVTAFAFECKWSMFSLICLIKGRISSSASAICGVFYGSGYSLLVLRPTQSLIMQ